MRSKRLAAASAVKAGSSSTKIETIDGIEGSVSNMKHVYSRKKKIVDSEVKVIGSSQAFSPYDWSKVPRGLQTKRRSNRENAVSGQKKMLDSTVFEGYLEKLWMSFSEDKRSSFTYLDCLWFHLYKDSSYKAKVLTWIKNKHIFSKKYVFVPIVSWKHWSLLILCHFGESLQSESGTRCMLLLDSLEMADPRRLEPDIRKFVLDIYKEEGRPANKNIVYRIPLMVPKVPQQTDGVDCGNFVLYYINLFMEDAPDHFSMEGYPYFMNKNWFTPEGLASFCKGLSSAKSDV
ncbi:Ubiquitin-like-specific protease 1D [Quillaja saponaria]|uniref:Ubiquitin-like-specific protease 1D n=1 Tax=Quillaja saponaria TaxID=32244 RepID=A0AAD7PHR9_QUISA|nr:Ubiquitin-like-specific protease 1D [Quillaja saponaria]